MVIETPRYTTDTLALLFLWQLMFASGQSLTETFPLMPLSKLCRVSIWKHRHKKFTALTQQTSLVIDTWSPHPTPHFPWTLCLSLSVFQVQVPIPTVISSLAGG